ncbi:MAG: transketolase [SAR324 cluster bacterium]|nr:transketolase [SAR324 cluster bacterium]
MNPELREKCSNTIRFLAADAVQKANIGHPGAPMGLADAAFVLWNKFLRYNPLDPNWANRDRFVLSAGHASMLLYSMLHLSGYELSLEELKQFRQWGSLTPGHPEYGMTPGVECTTGPLGAGFGNAVGMALGLKMAGARFNTSQHAVINASVFVICSDGDIQEGVCAESASLAGHLGLGNLIAIYDQNEITIGGSIKLSMSEDVGRRFEAYGWDVQHCDGHNHDELEACLQKAKANTLRPSIIVAKTLIGKGAPNKEGTAASHGAPLGDDEIRQGKERAGWPLEPTFLIPEEVRDVFKKRTEENKAVYQKWQEEFQRWQSAHPSLAELWSTHTEHKTPQDLLEKLVNAVRGKEGATRKLSHIVIQEAARLIPGFTGGSADLEPSNLTLIEGEKDIIRSSEESGDLPDPSFSGRNIRFGIREHAMGSITNGLYLSGSWLPFCATFSVFSDYMRGSLRLAAISNIPSIFVYSHDSFWVGEDGPTHQPVEQIWALRLIHNLNVWRPADDIETAAAWAYALKRPDGNCPSALFTTRQGVSNLKRAADFDASLVWKGGYVLTDSGGGDPQVTLISTGSEGSAVQTVRDNLEADGIAARHVSLPCLERFTAQPLEYQASVLPESSKIIVVEAGTSAPWYRYADHVVGRDSFGNSAPGKLLAEKYGFTAAPLTENIKNWLKGKI